jgi:competence protein ComEA
MAVALVIVGAASVRDGAARMLAPPVQPLPVDVNAAGPAELSLLPGVGPSLAAAIVADRERSGPFRSTDELDRVRGIGPAALARLRLHVAARDPAGDTAAAPAYAAP